MTPDPNGTGHIVEATRRPIEVDAASVARLDQAIEAAESAGFEALNTLTSYFDEEAKAEAPLDEIGQILAQTINDLRSITGQSSLRLDDEREIAFAGDGPDENEDQIRERSRSAPLASAWRRLTSRATRDRVPLG